jgi:hypothetical protein
MPCVDKLMMFLGLAIGATSITAASYALKYVFNNIDRSSASYNDSMTSAIVALISVVLANLYFFIDTFRLAKTDYKKLNQSNELGEQ